MRQLGFALMEAIVIGVVLAILTTTGALLLTNFQHRLRLRDASTPQVSMSMAPEGAPVTLP